MQRDDGEDSHARHRLVAEMFSDIVDRCAPADWDAEASRRAAGRPDLLVALRQLLAAHAAVTNQSFSRKLRAAVAIGWEVATAGLAPGTCLDPWVVLNEIGQGGMGRVYLAKRNDGLIDQRVAIKVARWRTSPQLTREAQLLVRLDHPAIVRLLDVGTLPDGQPYVVMEYIDGLPLCEHLRTTGTTPQARVRLLLPIVDAVAHAHARLVLHRDIKPSNILVDQSGQAHLLDFGVADLLAPGASEVALGHTPAYAAPEVLRGASGDVGVDIYSLGLTLAEAIGNQPTASSTQTASRLIPIANADLRSILAKATDADPARRYGSVGALADDLRRWLDHRPVSARMPNHWQRLQLLRRRHPLGVPLALVTSISLLILTASLAWQSKALIEQRDLAEAQRQGSSYATELLIGALAAVHPETAEGTTLELPALADEIAARSAATGASQPVVRLQVLATSARLKRALGRYADADATFAQLFQDPQVARLDADVLLRARLAWIDSLREQARYEEADAQLRLIGANDDWRVLQTRAQLLAMTAKPAEAIQLLAKAADQAPIDSLARADVLHSLGIVQGDTGDHRAAIGTYREAARLISTLGLADSVTAAHLHASAANSLSVLTEYDEAAREADAALQAYRRIYGERHYRYADALFLSGEIAFRRGKRDAARKLLDDAVVRYRTALGPEHPRVSNALNALGNLLQESGALDEAIIAYRSALAALMTTDPAHTQLATIRNGLGGALLQAGQLDAGSAELELALAGFLAQGKEPSPPTAIIRSNLAYAYRLLERQPQGLENARSAYAQVLQLLGPEHGLAAAFRTELAANLLATGQTDAALAEAQAAALILERLPQPVDRTWLIDSATVLAAIHRNRGDLDQAASFDRRREALEALRSQPPSQPP